MVRHRWVCLHRKNQPFDISVILVQRYCQTRSDYPLILIMTPSHGNSSRITRFINMWTEQVQNIHSNPILRTYCNIKCNFGMETYLDAIKDYKYRVAMSQLRTSSHTLAIEYGRYTRPKTKIEDRKCSSCHILEDERHFLIECNINQAGRENLFSKLTHIAPNFIHMPDEENSFSLCATKTNKYLHGLANSYINRSKIGLNTYHRYDAVCIFITLPESIWGVYQFSCVVACIPIQYKCIDTNELYFYRILYYRDFTSRYISYRIVYSILIGAGYVCMYIYIYINICIYIFICVYVRIYLCVCVYIYVYMPANVCYYVYMIICMVLCVLILCMLILWCFFFTYGCLVRYDLIKKFKQTITGPFVREI